MNASSTDSNELNIGIVGLRFGKWVARDLAAGAAAGDFRLAAVCDRIEQRAHDEAAMHDVPAYTDLDELLAKPDIPVIGLFTGPVGRAELIRKVIHAGKDVMTTKPFERDPAKGLAILQEAKSLGRVVHLNSPSPLPSAFVQQVQTWQAKHDFGHFVSCRTNSSRLSREQPDGTWYDDPDLCPGGPMFRLGIYQINDGIRLFGEAEAVQIMHSRIQTQRPTPDNAQMNVMFRGGGIMSIFTSLAAARHRYPHCTTMINYEHATIYQTAVPAMGGQSGRTELTLVIGEDNDTDPTIETVTLESKARRGYQWDAFRRAIAGEALEDEVTPEQIVHGLQVLDAMARAQHSGQTEKVDTPNSLTPSPFPGAGRGDRNCIPPTKDLPES